MRQALDVLQKMDSDLLGKRLLLHAICESRRYKWKSGDSGFIDGHNSALACGLSPMDIVQQAILQTLNGSRPWNDGKYPDITAHLKLAITSIVSNLATSSDNRRVERLPDMFEEHASMDAAITAPLDDIAGEEAGSLWRAVGAAVADDKQLAAVLEHLQDGLKPREIMAEMRLSASDIYRLTQKLRRRIAPIFRERTGEAV